VEACEKFVFLEVLAGEPRATGQAKDDQPRPIQSVLTKALNKVDTDDDDWASLSALGNHLNRTDPAFDSRTYGFGKLSDLVKAQPFLETKTVTGPGGRGQLWVRLKGRRSDADGPASRTAPKTAKTAAKKAAVKKATTATSTTGRTAAKKAASTTGRKTAKKVATSTGRKATTLGRKAAAKAQRRGGE
jgi:hypothetical protein